MHQFIVKSIRGKISPVHDYKQKLFDKMLKSYEDENKSFKITIEEVSKNINEGQYALYKAFIIKASDCFGNTYEEMEEILVRFHPKDSFGPKANIIPIAKWNSQHLEQFINKSTAFLAEYGFNF